MVRYTHEFSNGSAGARTVATISTSEGLPMSRYVARKHLQDLNLVIRQLLKHHYKNTSGEHDVAPNSVVSLQLIG